jgi:hypothetical protein
MHSDADKLLVDLVGRVVLEQLDKHRPTEWLHCSHFIPEPAASSGVWLVTDFSYLIKFINQPVQPFPSPETMFQTIGSNSKWFAKHASQVFPDLFACGLAASHSIFLAPRPLCLSGYSHGPES